MKITVTKDNVKIEEFDIVHEGEHRVNKCSFSFSEEYTEELVKKAIFTSQNSSIEVAIIDNECDIPTEILKARNIVLLGVYAYKVTEDKLDLRYSPSPDAFKVNSGSYIEGANESEEITPSQFDQYMQALNDGLNKVEEALKNMDETTSSATQLVDDINQKLENGDFIGPQGPQGVQGTPGKDGINGTDGVGITKIASGQSSVEDGKTITPVTVQKTDGSSQIFKVEAKNGQDGQDGVNGQDGLTPSIGENGNWFIGDTDTGKPSRGEVGPSPDLSNYVKNTDYASASKAGVLKINGNAARISSDGVLSAAEVSEEQYKTTVNSIFISKGTLDNVKNFLVESSTPVITLNNTLDNLVRKNRVSDYIVSLKDALKYKVFEFLVHGKVKQETTTGKNLLNYLNVKQFVSNGLLSIINNDGSITTTGIPTMNYAQIMNLTDITDMLEDGQTYTIMQKNATNKLYIQVNITTNSDENVYVGLNNNTENIKTFTVDKQNNKKYMIDIQSNSIETTDELNITNYYQLLKGSYDEWQPFEKYTGGQESPSSDYPQPITTLTFNKITRLKKNLLNNKAVSHTSNGITFTVNEDKTITVNGTATGYTTFRISDSNNPLIPITGNYISGGTNNVRFQIMNHETNSYITLASSNSYKSTPINKTQFERGYFELVIQEGTTVNNEIVKPMMTIEPITSEEYEPYQATEYAIDLQGNEMVELPNGVQNDLIIDKQGNVSLIKNIGKIVLDGSEDENWELSTNQTNTYIEYQWLNLFEENSGRQVLMTNYSADEEDNRIVRNNKDLYYRFPKYSEIDVSDVTKFKTWLQQHNIVGYYPLETPEVIPLGKLTELITTEEGSNTFFINGNLETTLEVLYARDSEKYLQQYIDDKLATLSQAIIEEG